MALPDLDDGKRLVRRRHAEWRDRAMRWRWLVDSYEGGDRYRRSSYGTDARGWPLRNLVRHPREYPAPIDQYGSSARISPTDAGTFLDGGSGLFADHRYANGPGGVASSGEPQGDDYWTRWWRTPPPTFVQEAVDAQLSRIYAREPQREGPPAYLDWITDVDGSGTPIDDWMREELAWRLLVLGCVDVLVDRPPVDGDLPRPLTVAERERLGLDRVEARVLDPQDVLDWELDRRREYVWVLNREYHPDESKDADRPGTIFAERYRLWTRDTWVLFDPEGRRLGEGEHGLGIVPQIRLMTRRAPRCTHVGVSLLEDTAELAREYYNRDSELVLDDANHSHPQLQGPAEPIESGRITIGPGWALPVYTDAHGNQVPWSVIDFPHGGAESLRSNKTDLRSAADRLNGLAKPAGESGAGVVSQSGLSKSFDERRLNDLLSRRADILANAERKIGRLVVAVAADGRPAPADAEAVRVSYSKRFELLGLDALAAGLAAIHAALAEAGRIPKVEARLVHEMAVSLLPGLSDEEYAAIRAEIEDAVDGDIPPQDVIERVRSLRGDTIDTPLIGFNEARRLLGMPGVGPDGDLSPVEEADAEREMAAQAQAQIQGQNVGPDGEPPEDAGEPEPEPEAEES